MFFVVLFMHRNAVNLTCLSAQYPFKAQKDTPVQKITQICLIFNNIYDVCSVSVIVATAAVVHVYVHTPSDKV